MACVPLVALAPLQPLDAVQEVALVEDQASVVEPPEITDVGLAEIETVGTGGGAAVTVTVTDWLAEPPAPVQVKVYVVVAVRLFRVCVPLVATAPLQPLDAVQAVALVEDQASVVEPPEITEVGLAEKETVGTGGGAEPNPGSENC